MNRHGSMNRIYRLIWNDALQAYVPVAETCRGRGKRSARQMAAAVMLLGTSLAQAAPSGGHVTAGNGTITASGTTTTIDQSSQNLALTWASFNVAGNETVDFVQPTASAIAVNRILGSDGSVILGHVNANGQVYLINPNGVVFGRGSVVNVGGLVASTLDLDGTTLDTAARTFSGSGRGVVSNQGTITAASGGSIALLGNRVSNSGVITAKLGTVALGGGSAVTLTFSGSHLAKMQVDESVLDSEAANGGLIRADGGAVLMTAGSQRSLLASVVNNTGIIEARSIENHDGTITLLGGMTAGTVNLGGTLDASAPVAGNGGAIETSAAHVEVGASARISTAAAHGLTGTWLIDPTDFTIAASGGDLSGAQLTTALSSANVTIDSNSGASGTGGNVNVNDSASWNTNTLTLSAQNNININATLNGSGTAKLALLYGQGALNAGNTSSYTVAAPVNLPAGPNFSTKLGSDGAVTNYTVVTDLGAAADALIAPSVATLQGIAATSNLSGNFVLGANINASATSGWNVCIACINGGAGHYGFTPIGNAVTAFSGTLDGLGHTIANLFVSQPSLASVGLFGTSTGTLRNVGLTGAAITGLSYAGGLVGLNGGNVSDSFVTGGSINGFNDVGGLIGASSNGAISHSYSTASVVGTGISVGGLVGRLDAPGSITDSYATGAVAGTAYSGGFVGLNTGGALLRDYASGSVSGSNYVGGFAGVNSGPLSNAYASGNVTASGSRVGGLIGANYATVDSAHASGTVAGANVVGGLIGTNFAAVTNSYATGTVNGQYVLGGLIGSSVGSIANSYATGNVSASGYAGGLVGIDSAAINSSFASGNVSGAQFVGGLIGRNNGGAVADTYATGSASGTQFIGGLIGFNVGLVSTSYAMGPVVASSATSAGGLIGWNGSTVTNSFYSTTANPTLTGSGGVADVAGSIWGMSTAELQTVANFSTATVANGGVNPAWDLTTTWVVYDGHTAPLLQAFMTPLTVGSTPVIDVYDGGAAFALTFSDLTFSGMPDMTHLFGTPSIGGTAAGAAHVGTYTSSVNGLYSDQFGYKLSYNPGSLTITPATVTVSGSTATKSYDGTTLVTLTGGTLAGVFAGDALTLNQTGSFASPHAGSNIAVTAAETLGGASAGDYTLTQPTGLTGSITPAAVTVSGSVVGNKLYDGTTTAAVTAGSLMGVVAGDSVVLTQAGTFASKNAGTGIAVTANDTLSGANAGDYTITEPTGLTATIAPATLTVSNTHVAGKVYDGSTNAALSGGSLVGVVAGDTVSLTQAGTFASKNAGTGIAVSANDSLGGTAASDYVLAQPTGLTASIAPASLTVGNTTVANKVYDGTSSAGLSGGELVGVIAGDTVGLVQAGTFASKNVGSNLAVTAEDSLSGSAASDYTVVQPTGLNGAITPAPLSVNGTVVGSRLYNGSNAATLLGGTLVGVVGGDNVTLNQSGTFASASAGTHIAVTATDTLGGANADDYSLAQPTGLTGTIYSASGVSDPASKAALSARAQIESDLLSANVNISAPLLESSSTPDSLSDLPLAENITLKIGPTSTLRIENGGLRLPTSLAGKE